MHHNPAGKHLTHLSSSLLWRDGVLARLAGTLVVGRTSKFSAKSTPSFVIVQKLARSGRGGTMQLQLLLATVLLLLLRRSLTTRLDRLGQLGWRCWRLLNC